MTGAVVDLRSDTVTRPSPAMLRAMAAAPVGDDVYGDDPTVNALQERCAALMGKAAALFVPTGSMANLAALGALARPAEEVICDLDAHVLTQEGGGVTCLGLLMRSLPGERGLVPAERVRAAIRPGDDHGPRTAVVSIETTHTTVDGRPLPLADVRAVADVCRAAGVAVHVDGARVFNAQVATGIPARAWAGCADTIVFCFSKGLGAPAGAMVCGAEDVVERARLLRKRLGGAMRQTGLLAAAAAAALDEGVERLADDHALARRLADGAAALDADLLDPADFETNIVYLDARPLAPTAAEAVARLRAAGVLAKADAGRVRLVTHRDVGERDVDTALAALRTLLAGA